MKKKKGKKSSTVSKKDDKPDVLAKSSKDEEAEAGGSAPPSDLAPSNGDMEEGEPVETHNTTNAEEAAAADTQQRVSSLSDQSKLRSASFRQTNSGPKSPSVTTGFEGDTAPEIYKKQAAKIEELEKENRLLAKEAAEAEKRWKKLEAEVEDLREAETEDASAKTDSVAATDKAATEEIQKLVCVAHFVESTQT